MVVTYNQENLIAETLESVLAQDYENLQIVVADDGSDDSTPEMVRQFANRNSEKIYALTDGKNLGVTGNFNRALAKCCGKYIAFIGGDDIMSSNKISMQVSFMEARPDVAVSYHNLDVFDSDTGATLYLFNHSNKYSGDCAGYVRRGCVNGGSATMVRSDCIPSNGFVATLPVASDWYFYIQTLADHNKRIEYIDHVLGRYRRHSANVTNVQSPFSHQGLQDSFAACALVLVNYPVLASDALFRLGALLRGQRFRGNYLRRLISSLRASFQIKTLILLILYILSFGKIRL